MSALDRPCAGRVYSFLNCDTGRHLSVAGVSRFLLEGEETFTLRAGRSFVGTRADALTEQPEGFSLIPFGRGRFALQGPAGCLADDDEGLAPVCHPVLRREAEDVSALWYPTAEGEKEPLKIMLLGDSITFGSCPDLPEEDWVGCAPVLSAALAKRGENRFCLVGSQRQKKSAVSDPALYRREGHPGWFTEDVFRLNPETRGLCDILDDCMGKYRPDVVLSQMGTNDTAFTMGRRGRGEEEWTEEWMDEVYARLGRYAEMLLNRLPMTGKLVLATAPDTTRTACFHRWLCEYNRRLPAFVEGLQKRGYPVFFADTFTPIAASTPEKGLCSDQVHLSPQGYRAMGLAYEQVLGSLFDGPLGQ